VITAKRGISSALPHCMEPLQQYSLAVTPLVQARTYQVQSNRQSLVDIRNRLQIFDKVLIMLVI